MLLLVEAEIIQSMIAFELEFDSIWKRSFSALLL